MREREKKSGCVGESGVCEKRERVVCERESRECERG